MLKFILFDELGPYHTHISLQDDIFNVSFSPEIFYFWKFAQKSKWKTLQFFNKLSWEQFYVLRRRSCWGLGKNSISHFETTVLGGQILQSFRNLDEIFHSEACYGLNYFWKL